MAQGDNIIIDVGGNTRQLEKDIARVANQSINLNVKGFGQPLGKISGQLGEFEKSLAASNARVIAFGASAGAIFAVERALTQTVKAAIQVEKSLADINVILGANTGTLRNFGAELFNIAKGTGQSFDVVSKAATELSRQGLGIEQTLKRTSDALILARLSGMDTVSTVEALTAAINSFSKSALDSSMIINKLAAVDAAFAVSSGDLAEAIKRVGSSAEDAGVSFDQLIAIVTSAQQITSRGGAVIGNSLKTIFTRLQRSDTLDALEQIGVVTKNAQGEILPLINILTSLSRTYDQLNSVQKSSIAETVGGVFQINVLKAALGDLSSEYSIFSRALQTSVGATDEAIARNEKLNETLDSLINKTLQNLTKVGAGIGQDIFGPALKKVLGGLNSALESFGEGDSQDVGSKIGKGLMKGLGDFLSGPGLAIGGLALFKIFERLTVFSADAFKSLTGLNSKAAEQKILQSQILSILSKNPEIIKQINSGQISLVDVHKTLLNLIQQETVALTQQAAIAATLSKTLGGAGVRIAQKGPTKGLPTATRYEGYIPNYSLSEELGGVQRSSDYSRSEKNNARPFLTNLNGETIYANNQEIKVPAKDIYKRMGLPEGTKPKNSAEKYGILNPKQQRLLGFNQGFIPNFKNPKTISSDQLVGQINTLSSVKNIPIDESDPNNSKMRLDSLKNSVQGLRELKAAISISDDFSGKDYVKDKIEEEFKDLQEKYDKEKIRYKKSLYVYKDIFSAVRAEMDMKEEYSKGFIPNFNKKKSVRTSSPIAQGPVVGTQSPAEINLNELDKTIGSKYGVLVGQGQNESPANYTQGVADIPILKNVLPKGSGVSVRLKQRAAFPLTEGGIGQSEKEFDLLLQQAIGPGLQDFAQNIKKNILGKDESVQPFVSQLGKDVKGSLFEKSVRAALITPSQVDRISSDDPQAPFDFDPASSFLGFQELFGLKNVKAVEAKVSDTAAKSGRLPNKVLAKEPSLLEKIIGKYAQKPAKFRGFIPNFEDDLDEARKEAFDREKSASGLSSSQIKLVKDKRLKNRLNPYGEAVINKRDEPSGTAGEGIKRFKSLSDARSAGMPDMRWTGYIPNFAKGRSAKQPKKGSGEGLDTAPAQSALNKFQDKALLASFAFSTLGGVVEQFMGDFNPKGKSIVNSMTSGASAFATLAGVIPGQAGLIIGAVAGIGVAANGIIKGLKAKGPELTKALEEVKDENQRFADSTGKYLETYNRLNESLEDTEGNQDQITQNIIKLNKELTDIAFELPEKYREEILSIQDSATLQNRIGEIRSQQLEKEKALLAATDLQLKIDNSQGLGRSLLGMGQNVLNEKGSTRRVAANVTGDMGKENLIKLTESGDLSSKNQKELIDSMVKVYGVSEELGGALSQLSSSDFEGLRSVLISSGNDVKNLTELTKELNAKRKEEQDKIRALNKAISESKAKIADLGKAVLDDLVQARAMAETKGKNRREILAKDFDSRTELNKQFQTPEAIAQGSYDNETVKIEQKKADDTAEVYKEANVALTDKLQEMFFTNKESGGGSITPEAQVEILKKLTQDFNEKTVTPDILAREIEEILKSQDVNKDELEKLRKENEKQNKETLTKLQGIEQAAIQANKLNQLALKYAQMQNQISKDLKSGGGYDSFMNPEKDTPIIEEYLKNYEMIKKVFQNPDAPTGRDQPMQQARTIAQIAQTDKDYYGVEPTDLDRSAIKKGISRQLGEKYQGGISEKEAAIKNEEEKNDALKAERVRKMESVGIPRDSGRGTNIMYLNNEIENSIKESARLEGERRKKQTELAEAQIAFDPKTMSQKEQDENTAKKDKLKEDIASIREKEKEERASRTKLEGDRTKEYDEINLAPEDKEMLKRLDESTESRKGFIESEKIKVKEFKEKSTPEALDRMADNQVKEKLKSGALTEGGYSDGVERIVEAIKGGKTEGEEKDNLSESVSESIKAAGEAASNANIAKIQELIAALKSQQEGADKAKKDAEEATKRTNKEVEAKQAEGKTAASKEALKASGKSLFGAKAQAYSFFEEDEESAARMSAGAGDISKVIDNALKENPNINSTEDLIKELKTNKEFGDKITTGTSIGDGDLKTELEAAYAKKGTEQREGAFVGGIDSYIKNVKNEQKLKTEAESMQPKPPQQTEVPQLEIGGPTNIVDDFLKNPPAQQPAGPLTPQPQDGRPPISAQGSASMKNASMENSGKLNSYGDVQGSASSMGSFGTLNSYGDPQSVDPTKVEGQILGQLGEGVLQVGDLAEKDRKEQIDANAAGGAYLDKKYPDKEESSPLSQFSEKDQSGPLLPEFSAKAQSGPRIYTSSRDYNANKPQSNMQKLDAAFNKEGGGAGKLKENQSQVDSIHSDFKKKGDYSAEASMARQAQLNQAQDEREQIKMAYDKEAAAADREDKLANMKAGWQTERGDIEETSRTGKVVDRSQFGGVKVYGQETYASQKMGGKEMVGNRTSEGYIGLLSENQNKADDAKRGVYNPQVERTAPMNSISDFLRNPPQEEVKPLVPQSQDDRTYFGHQLQRGGTPNNAEGSTAMGSTFGTLNSYGNPQKPEGQVGKSLGEKPLDYNRPNEKESRKLDKGYDEMMSGEEERSKKNRARFNARGDNSEDTKNKQIKSAESQSKDSRKKEEKKDEDSKAQVDLKASLDNLSGKIEADTESRKEAKEKDKEGSEGKAEGKLELEIPKIEIPTIDININVQGSIDQIPSETSAKTVQAIKDVVNQILPGEISKRLGALKA